MANLVIKLNRQLTEENARGKATPETELSCTLAEYGARLAKSEVESIEASQYFSVLGVADDRINALRDDLARLGGVEAAFVKPSDALP